MTDIAHAFRLAGERQGHRMRLQLSEDQQFLQEAAARMFKAESPPARVRAAEASGFDPALWNEVVALGIPLALVPENRGGSGLSLFDTILVAEQGGRHLVSVPLAESIAAAQVLAALGGEAEPWLQKALEGALITFVPRPLEPGQPASVNGAVSAFGILALDGDEVILISGGQPPASEPNLASAQLSTIALDLPHCKGSRHVLARGREARANYEAAIETWKLLSAAMLAGLGRQSLVMAAEYSKERTQFGKPIGSYQGIAHPLADALTEVDGAQLLIWRAVWAISEKREDAGAAVSMAWWWATQAAARAVARALHTFGGYGVSLEYDIQLYYRRGMGWGLLAGDPHDELLRVADRLWSGARPPLPHCPALEIEFGCGKATEDFANSARRFFEENLTDELRAHAHHSVAGFHPEFNRKLAAAGFLFPHWPKLYGGHERGPFDMAALAEVFEEFNWERITGPITNQVAQVVMLFGTEELKCEVLPRFGSGESLACLGFTEPSCGSDVFAARTRAVRDGDEWVINGQKIFTTAANLADYVFLLARTNPDAPKHAGLSIFLVPLNAPGVEIQAVETMQDERTNITYYSDVRIPDRYRIGEVDGGLSVMAATLEMEHGGGNSYRIAYANMVRHAVAWARETTRNGKSMLENPHVRERIARIAVHSAVAEALCHRAIWGLAEHIPGRSAFGPMSKVFSTEYYHRDACELMNLTAPESLFARRSGLGHIEIGYRQSIGMTIYGGTSEVQRSLIAEQGLGMPRSRS